jgi:hypothetical protein
MEHLRNFPMSFSGHFETHYQQLGFRLDGNYMGMDFDHDISKGLEVRLGIMEYAASYRLIGSTASERVSRWDDKSTHTSFDIYAGGRTIWLGLDSDNTASNDKSITSPIIGGQIVVDISPHWYISADGSVGGFGVDKVSFTSTALGAIGYRTRLFGIPASVQAGYKALSVKVNKPVITSDIEIHGPYIGLTGYW